jgi:hypothetical protein
MTDARHADAIARLAQALERIESLLPPAAEPDFAGAIASTWSTSPTSSTASRGGPSASSSSATTCRSTPTRPATRN